MRVEEKTDQRLPPARPGRPAGPRDEKPGVKSEDGKLKEAVRSFEAVFIKQMLSQMRASARALGGGEVSSDRRIYEDWQDDKLAEEMSKGGGIGLAEILYRQLKPEPNGGDESS